MLKCDFEWSMCQTCSKAGSNLCPLENNRTIKDLKYQIEKLKREIDDLKYKLEELRR